VPKLETILNFLHNYGLKLKIKESYLIMLHVASLFLTIVLKLRVNLPLSITWRHIGGVAA